MCKPKSKWTAVFNWVCIQLIFLLAAALILLMGVRVAGKTIRFAQAEKIEIINNLVDGLSESSHTKFQGKKLQNVTYKYVEAFLKAMAGFEFIPRNDFKVLPSIINSLPEGTEVLSFVYHGRNLTIKTVQQYPSEVLETVDQLQKRVVKGDNGFEKVVYSYYIDKDDQCIAEITMIVHHYDERDLNQELEKKFFPESKQQ